MSQHITKQALALQDFIWENCPDLKETTFVSLDRLIDLVVACESDLDECKSILEGLNEAYS
jgi:hypothetical protein